MTLWLVRAGKHGERENQALEKSVVVVGWDELEDLAGVTSREKMHELLQKTYPEAGRSTVSNWVGQLWSFVRSIQPRDLAVLPLKSRPAIAIARIEGDYQYRTDLGEGLHHTRPVKWLGEWPRSSFDQDLLYSMGAAMTVCSIRRNRAEERIRALVEGVPTPPHRITLDDEETSDLEAAPDLEEYARDQIREYVSRKFRGHALTNLVSAVLEAQGYKVEQAPAGPDGGVDIIAGRGPLGFDPPRLAVQVKSSDAPADVKVLRELQGAMKNFGAEQGLFVSWGGYKGSVTKEAARIFFEIRLWDSDDVVRMVQAHYDQLPDVLQAELPLKRVWTLVQSDESDTG